MSARARQLLLLAPLAVGLVLVPLWCLRDPAPSVRTVVVERGPLEVHVTTNGEVEPMDEAEVEVRARFDGRVVDIPDPGRRVRAGERVVRIDDGLVSAELAAAESERLTAIESLRAARHALAVARERFNTDRGLYAAKALTRERYAESEAALEDAEERAASLEREVPLRVASLDLRLEELGAQKASAVVEAPFAGTVYRTAVERGELVRAGQPLLWIADLARLRVRANVDQVDLGKVRAEQRVEITSNAYPGRTWLGRVTEVVPHVVVKENRNVSEALARLDPPADGLVPGMTVDVEIVIGETAAALQVPAEAVFAKGDESFVYRLVGRRVRETPVTLGLTSVTSAEVVDGLAEHDRVVVGSLGTLRDGMRVDSGNSTGHGR
jgi:RND family efflux transporter MFP subunit